MRQRNGASGHRQGLQLQTAELAAAAGQVAQLSAGQWVEQLVERMNGSQFTTRISGYPNTAMDDAGKLNFCGSSIGGAAKTLSCGRGADR